jgi:hypothetical protein
MKDRTLSSEKTQKKPPSFQGGFFESLLTQKAGISLGLAQGILHFLQVLQEVGY